MQSDTDDLPPLRERVAQACDTCKQRKVKCDGQTPCSYCKRRHRAHTCRFSPPIRRRRPSEKPRRSSASPSVVAPPSNHIRPATPTPALTPPTPIPATTAATIHVSPTLTRHSDVSAEEEAEVPRDARLICDAQGRLVFIGDCAPLSLFQTVRQIVTSRVDPHAFAPETSRVSMLENIDSEGLVPLGPAAEPAINPSVVRQLVVTYLTVVSRP
ncbi:hypothetical protein F4801DRAFT_242395 [Xylaria longipes]|nr:hypothetical protein F4801DRAFT_242395 [Xylaria longipes]